LLTLVSHLQAINADRPALIVITLQRLHSAESALSTGIFPPHLNADVRLGSLTLYLGLGPGRPRRYHITAQSTTHNWLHCCVNQLVTVLHSPML